MARKTAVTGPGGGTAADGRALGQGSGGGAALVVQNRHRFAGLAGSRRGVLGFGAGHQRRYTDNMKQPDSPLTRRAVLRSGIGAGALIAAPLATFADQPQ